MTSVAKRLTFGALTSAEINGFGLLGGKNDWAHVDGGMATVAKRLFAAFTTGAPSILFARFNSDFVRFGACDFRVGHVSSQFMNDIELRRNVLERVHSDKPTRCLLIRIDGLTAARIDQSD